MPEVKKEKLVKLRALDTLRGGQSLAPITGSHAGTLGYFVKQKSTVGIISSQHVTGDFGTKLISPAPMDGGKSDDYIGTVKSAVSNQAVDCAFAPLRRNITKYYLTDGTSVTGTEEPREDIPIKFCGCRSGHVTKGHVKSINWCGRVGEKQYHNQILISAPVAPGDSGSLLINRDNNKAIGLIFAETPQQKGLANHIDEVLKSLDVQIAE